MIKIIYCFIFSYMIFFSICIAPVVNNTLDRTNASKLLRKIFPRNFIYGSIMSFILVLLSIYSKSWNNLYLGFSIFALFLLNLYIIVPQINQEADKFKKEYSKKFKKLHLISVLLYVIQMILALTGIIVT